MDSESSSDQETMLNILDEELSLEELSPIEENYIHENLHNSEFVSLCLDYKDIKEMDFIHDFTSLERLDLNNNLIQNIRGLERLTNLTLLNLSLNRIENIEGLESLQKLETLNLSYNKISVLKNMDSLENLRSFFISKNLISQKESILYLRRFKRLFTLSLAGNPFNEMEDHSFYIAAFLPNLTIIDRIFIDKKMKEEALVKYKLELKQFRLQELQKHQADGFEQNPEDLLKDEFVENIVNVTTKPVEVAPALQTTESQMLEQIFAKGSAEHKLMESELNSFHCGQIETEAYYQQRTSQILGEFEEQHTQRIFEIKKQNNPELEQIRINTSTEEISKLYKNLLTLEFDLVRNLDDNIKQLDSCFSEMLFTGHDLGNHDDLKMIDDKKNPMATQVNEVKAAFINEIQEKEEKRHRVRISDIHRYVEYLKKQLEDLTALKEKHLPE